jgi:hypothetical protein
MIALLLLPLSVFLVWICYRSLKRKRLIENVPTTPVAGIVMGLNEVIGTVQCEQPLVAHLSELPCAWYSYRIEEFYQRTSTSTDDDGNEEEEVDEGWELVHSNAESCPFLLVDDSGSVRVVPDRAECTGNEVLERRVERQPMDLLERRSSLNRRKPPPGALDLADHRAADNYDGGADRFDLLEDDDALFADIPRRHHKGGTGYYRMREYIIAPGDELYVLASGRCREDVAEPELAHDEIDDVFVLSVKGEAAVVRAELWTSIISFFAALGALLAAAWLADQDGKIALTLPRDMVAIACLYLALASLGYGVLLYNGLVDVRHRVLRSWTLIDVQLKRRHDLIPRLAECVAGYAAHEQEVQNVIAGIRSGKLGKGSGGVPSNKQVRRGAKTARTQRRAMGKLLALGEAYPDLKGSAVYQELHTNLVDTEDRIALARRFFNDSVTAYNDRIATVPDLFVARLARLTPARLYAADEGETEAVAVEMG